ncbi:MAG: hypothetical protein EHM45_05140 [Desulfobacteraceae bacterium]|nr:MAG: hypothetical protein EHM45_05140 [Desulfobacteraceae bacterium]
MLPNKKIENKGIISSEFVKLSLTDFLSACQYVQELPYGRTSKPKDFLLVLKEQHGTCSSKHALLAALAEELGLPLSLTLGIYRMTAANTPGVGPILAKHRMEFIPEAHCYLTYQNERFDFTKKLKPGQEPITEFLTEEIIIPVQIGAYKTEFHKAFLRDYYGPERLDEIWAIREECIKTLSD